ncbi:MAG: hypothetical protein L0H84_14450 [Pseudonocardia sp.]|nr:hypothetical protein [Pseudonocardia sp.]
MLLAVVVNSRSGGAGEPDRIVELLGRGGARVERLSLDELDGPLPDGAARLVVAGGDGSIGVAARAAAGAGVPLAVVPTGTANDFARALDLPADIDAACALAADPAAATQHHEIGVLDGQPFVNAAAAGLSAVASSRAETFKSRLGALAYPLGAVMAGLTASPLRCRVRCDDAECFAGEAWQVVIGVTGAFGGGSGIGATSPDDAVFDVAVVAVGPRWQLLRRAVGMRRHSLTEQPGVGHHRGQVVEVELPAGTAFNVDGDLREALPARFTMLPGGVEVVAG